ncbi:MAG: ribose-phosphate pyrophosphokinase [candidate division Zixibacteria bacterium]|nr:ribose-phosphate pyrophosphokinase [candidate division Zixibacteria bacterium]MDD5426364.1 ribose-phosphate pyrophosphokinase [candidate division Zixibacteria bacterium]
MIVREEIRLVTGNSNINLAKKIAAYIGVDLTDCTVTRFSDKEVFVQINENIRGADLFIIQPTNPPAENLMELLMLIEASRRASAMRITAVMPYYGYARQDRKDRPRVSITAKLIANLITTAGADRIMTMDLHASQIQGFFDLPHDHLYSAVIFNNHIRETLKMDNLVVVSPDVGSLKLARATASSLNAELAIVDKRRQRANQSEVMNLIGDVKNKNVLIRDDMVDTAGTICNAAKFIKQRGAKTIIAACTHGVLSGDAINKINESPIEKMIISDSIDQKDKNLSEKFIILSCSELIGEAIHRIFDEDSVSSLFEEKMPAS